MENFTFANKLSTIANPMIVRVSKKVVPGQIQRFMLQFSASNKVDRG